MFKNHPGLFFRPGFFRTCQQKPYPSDELIPLMLLFKKTSSIADTWNFGTDPDADPGIHTSD
jgi:hypothetical protein